MAFAKGGLATDCTWYAIVFLPKFNGEYRIIGLLGMLWGVIYINIDQCLEESINFYDVLHGFRSQRGTGKNTLESKPLHNIVGMRN